MYPRHFSKSHAGPFRRLRRNEFNARTLKSPLEFPKGVSGAANIWCSLDPLNGRETDLRQYCELSLTQAE
jgi:hypothetical protein